MIYLFKQYFNNEELEASRYDKYLKKYNDASLKTAVSRKFFWTLQRVFNNVK